MTTEVIHGNCVDVLRDYRNKVDLILTSPPYGTMRTYEDHIDEFDFEDVALRCRDALKPNGVMVWVVGDQSIDNSLSLGPMHQAIFFKDALSLKMIDIMIYEKTWAPKVGRKYLRAWEYMFVMARGNDYTFNPIMDRKNAWAGSKRWGKHSVRSEDGSLKSNDSMKDYVVPEYGRRTNVWRVVTGWGNTTEHSWKNKATHPAMFPLALAEDHIKTWTNPGDLVLDPMAGGGTTLVAAERLGRNAVGIEVVEKYVDEINARLQQGRLV